MFLNYMVNTSASRSHTLCFLHASYGGDLPYNLNMRRSNAPSQGRVAGLAAAAAVPVAPSPVAAAAAVAAAPSTPAASGPEGMNTRRSTPGSRLAVAIAAEVELEPIPDWDGMNVVQIYDAVAAEISRTSWKHRLLNGRKYSKVPRFGNVLNAMFKMLMEKGALPQLPAGQS